jgi:hypothetical protein
MIRRQRPTARRRGSCARRGAILTDPPGFCHSAFAQSSTPGVSRSKRCSRTSGVRPIRSSTEVPARSAEFNVEGDDMLGKYDRTSPDYINGPCGVKTGPRKRVDHF